MERPERPAGAARSGPRLAALLAVLAATLVLGTSEGILGLCGLFTDVNDAAFCPFVLEIFTLAITTGTTPTTYDPAGSVTRLQMAVFLSRSVDGMVRRGSRRAAMRRFWTITDANLMDVTTVGLGVRYPAFDGLDLWVPALTEGTVSRVRSSDGTLLQTWTGAVSAHAALSAIGKVFVTGYTSPGSLYRIDPRQAAGAVTIVASNLGGQPIQPAFDGGRIWTANFGGSVSIVTPGAAIPWTVTTVSAGLSPLAGALFDGSNIWVTGYNAGALFKLDANGAVLQTVTVGVTPLLPVFDGANIWVPNFGSASVSVVRASNGALLATLTGNGLGNPTQAAFDGERVLIPNDSSGSVSLWKAADLTILGTFPTGPSSSPFGACADGVNFWITFRGNQLARF
jgi:hypothetical protein